MRTTVLLVALAVAGCTAEISGTPGTKPGSTGPSGTTTNNGMPGSPNGGAASVAGGGAGSTNMTPGVEGPSPRLLRQLTLNEYRSTVTDLLHITDPDTTAIPPDVTIAGYTTNVTGTFVNQSYMDAYASTGAALAARAVKEAYATLVTCTTQDTACATTFITSFGLHAFRRPVTSDETARYLKLFDPSVTGGDFKVGVGLVLQTMLISPNFLFRSELGTDGGQGTFALTQYEVASALSYTYWGTMPDDALFSAASSAALANKTEIETQARRLLADPRGRARIASFFYEWLESPRAYIAAKDIGTYPNLYKGAAGLSGIVDAMRAEEDAFVTNVVFDSTKKFSELFTADYTFANDTLAGFYGLPAPGTGDKAAKVSLGAGSPRAGLLTMGMFLLGHARTNESSPTQRGHLIRANILCTDIPPPPPNVNTAISQGAPGATARQQITALTSTGICVSCHSLQDPIGFGLEGFGGDAMPRTIDNGGTVDSSGQINSLPGTSAPIAFNGAKELATILATNDIARKCLATNYYRYARGFVPLATDLPASDKLGQTFVDTDQDIPDMFVQVALQDSFTSRRSAETLTQ
ncbi:MAG TPA: DUF1592 domain-containing protein [Polyangiaceae bacterium]|jgi:hypothetical protein|nr:DUF1592 domain-containing protein [Polyangiaceae bacterium]